MTQPSLFKSLRPPKAGPRGTQLPAPWRCVYRPAPSGPCGAAFEHPSGWRIKHCGHPTALWPYELRDPDGYMILAPNGRAWRTLALAAAEAARRG